MTNRRTASLLWIATVGIIVVVAVVRPVAPAHNPVLELFAPPGLNLSPAQLDDVNTSAGLARMVKTLAASHRAVPEYLRLVADEYAPKPRQTATFAVGCYWDGERDLGRLNGVLATRTGMIGHDEVVELDYDPAVMSYSDLVSTARRMSCFRSVYARDGQQQREAARVASGAVVRSDQPVDTHNQQQFHLSMHPEYFYLPLTALQATKVNAALFAHEDPDQFLSPAQLSLRDRMARVLARGRDAAGSFDRLTPRRNREDLAGYGRMLQSRLAALGA